jgi:hypothetical protein
MRSPWSILAVTACALGLAIPLAAANGTAANKSKATTVSKAGKRAWPPETLSAKIAAVHPDENLVVVETPDEVTYDLVVTAKTRIKSGEQTIALKDLSQDKNMTVSVNFVPERGGDVAKSIQVGG